jgi:hypothetical protein
MIEFKFIGGAYEGRSPNLNAQKCQNLYPLFDAQGGKNVVALASSPGLKVWSDCGYAAEVRQLFADETHLYAVIGNRVYRYDSVGTAVQMTGTIGSNLGMAWMAKNANDQIAIVGPPSGNVLNTVTQIVTSMTTTFAGFAGLAHQDGYFLGLISDSDIINYSALNDSSFNSLDYFAAESQPDNLVTIASSGRDLWLFGQKTSEVWYNDGSPFARYQNVFFEIGCGASGSVCVTSSGPVMVDSLFRVVNIPTGSYQVVPVSTYQIDYQIKQMTNKANARAYWYQGEGHTFYVLTFPDDSKTFELNMTTGMWNTRARGETDARHRGNCSACFNGKWIVGDFDNGKLYELDYDTFKENGEVMRGIRRAQAVHQNRDRIFHHELELEFETGVGLIAGEGEDPQAMLRYSDDGGHTWSNERWRSMGKLGGYTHRVKWNLLGQARSRIYEVVVSDPVRRNIINAYLNADNGKILKPGQRG